jgi:hypothetical protein
MINFLGDLQGIQYGLGFRAMHKKDGKYISPVYDDFVWPQEGLVYASCNRAVPVTDVPYRVLGKNEDNPSWHSLADIPHEDCTCGFYTAFKFGPATLYEDAADQAVLFLVQVGGDTIYYDNCMRSAQLEVLACIGKDIRLSDEVAMNYFEIGFMQMETAKYLVDIQNTRVAMYCDPPFEYNPAFIDRDLATRLALQLPPLEGVEIEDPTEAIAVDNWPIFS